MNQGHLPLSETHINIIRTAKYRSSMIVKSAVWTAAISLIIGASFFLTVSVISAMSVNLCTNYTSNYNVTTDSVFPLLDLVCFFSSFLFCKYTCVSTLVLACVVSGHFLADNHMCKRLRVITFI